MTNFGGFLFIVLITNLLFPESHAASSTLSPQRRQVLDEVPVASKNLRTGDGDSKASISQAVTNTAVSDGVDLENDGLPVSRTATGGVINTLLSFLTLLAFIGNGAFMVYSFWLSK